MEPLAISEIWTLILAVLAIQLGMVVHRLLPRLQDWNIPAAITGGLLIASLIATARFAFGVELLFADGIRQTLLLIFFAGIGLSAKFGALIKGGAGVAVVCLAIVVIIVAQNLVGVAIAHGFGFDKSLGLFFGSIPFLGGHGTAAAWAQATPAEGLQGAFEVGMACATMGLVAGGLVAGPISSSLARRETVHDVVAGSSGEISEATIEPQLTTAQLLSSDRWLIIVLIVGVCLGLGEVFRQWAATHGMVVPGFLAVMAVGVVLTNIADLLSRRVDLIVTDLTGTVALRLFLAISMMGLKLWALADFILPLMAALILQIFAVVLVAVAVVYPLLGRGYTGAVACGGFIGFALGAMPVGLGVMKRVTTTLGPSPQAFLVLTLAAALFADTANAVLVNLGFSLLK